MDSMEHNGVATRPVRVRSGRVCRRCDRSAVGTVVVTVLGEDRTSFWCRRHLDALDLAAAGQMLSAGVVLRAVA